MNRQQHTGQPTDRIVVLMDSNKKNIDFHKLFNQPVTVVPCPTVAWAHRAIQRGLGKPAKVIIHIGTNDLDSVTPLSYADDMISLAEQININYKCPVIILEVLVRRPNSYGISLNDKVDAANELLRGSRFSTISHSDVHEEHLYDEKHLNRNTRGNQHLAGSQIFAKNLYKALYESSPSMQRLEDCIIFPEHREGTNSSRSHNKRWNDINSPTLSSWV